MVFEERGPDVTVVARTGDGGGHELYKVSDVEAALGRSRRDSGWSDDLPFGEDRPGGSRERLLVDLVKAGTIGALRTLATPTEDAIARVRELDSRAPHLRSMTDAVVVRLRSALTIGLPVTLPPMLLLGPPGVGKSWYMARLSEALGVPFRNFAVNLASVADGLSGSHPIWRATSMGLVARTLLHEGVANPLILVDELDKPPERSVCGDIYRPFHALLEREGARAFVDEHLGFPIDASEVLWVASANDAAEIPAALLDRLTTVEVGTMSRDDHVTVVRSLFADLNSRQRDFFEAPPSDVVEVLAGLPPRRARIALDEAMARAAADGRRALRPEDVSGTVRRQRPERRPRGMH